jgi:hypothetical protein
MKTTRQLRALVALADRAIDSGILNAEAAASIRVEAAGYRAELTRRHHEHCPRCDYPHANCLCVGTERGGDVVEVPFEALRGGR